MTAIDMFYQSRSKKTIHDHVIVDLETSSLSVSMFLFLGIVLFPAVSSFEAGFSCGKVNRRGKYVVGGVTAEDNEYPWQVRLKSQAMVSSDLSGSFVSTIWRRDSYNVWWHSN